MSYLKDFVNLLFPNVCCLCGKSLFKHESILCLRCVKDLPRSYYHLVDKNPVRLTFWGRADIKQASAFLLYVKGSQVKKILHSMKYSNNKMLGYELGRIYGMELKETNLFKDVDVVVPVPLHPKKLRIRGYNQSEFIAKGLCESLGKTLCVDGLLKLVHTTTQTRKGRFERWENVSDVFKINERFSFVGKSILLVDDVLTTGATLEACAKSFDRISGVKLNIATLAYASM